MVTTYFHLLVDNFMKYLENIKSASPHTRRAYSRDLSQALSNFSSLEQFLKDLPQVQLRWKDLSSASRNRKAAALKSFLRFLAMEGLCNDEASRKVISPKVDQKLPHFISVDEALCVLEYLSRQIKLNQENFDKQVLARQKECLFLLLYGGGLRVSEACQMKNRDISPSQRVARIQGKGGKERIVALPQRCFDALSSFQSSLYVWGEEPLSPRKAYEWIRQMGHDANLLRPIHPHALRHSFATHLLRGGANLRCLQELLGHSSLSATQRYTQVSIDELGRTLETRHPLSLKSNVSR